MHASVKRRQKMRTMELMAIRKSFIVLILFFLFIGIVFLQPLSGDGDFFHHLNTGAYIVTHHTFPFTDDYTFTARGLPWVAYAWGTGLIYYLLFTTVGASGISLWVSLFAVATAFLLYRYVRMLGMSRLSAAIATAAAMAYAAARWPNRPELATYPAVLLILIFDRLAYRQPRVLFFYPILFLVWTNVYGSSTLAGLCLLIGLTAWRLLEHPQKEEKNVRLVTLVLSIATSLTTPYGLRSLFYIFYIPQVAKIQGEWAGIIDNLTRTPVDFRITFQYRVVQYILYGFVVVAAAVFSLFRKPRPWKLLSLAAAVCIPFFVFRLTPLGALLPAAIVAFALARSTGFLRKVLFVAVSFVAVTCFLLDIWIAPPGIGMDTDAFPADVVAYARTHHLSGNAFTSQQLGAFMSYYLYPTVRVYSDTRDDLFATTHVISDLYDTYMKGTSIIPLLTRSHATVAFLDVTDGVSLQPLFHSTDWTPVYINGQYAIVVRAQEASRLHLQPLDAIDPYSSLGVLANKVQQSIGQYRASRQQDPNNVSNTLRLVSAYIANYDPLSAFGLLGAISLPRGPRRRLAAITVDQLMAQAYQEIENCTAIKQVLDRIDANRRYAFLFSPDELLQTSVERDYALYYLSCAHDTHQAAIHLQKYLTDPTFSAAEKKEAQAVYNQVEQTVH